MWRGRVSFWRVGLGEYSVVDEVVMRANMGRAFCNGALIRLDGGASLVSKI